MESNVVTYPDLDDLLELVELYVSANIGHQDEFDQARARHWARGFTYLPQPAIVTQMAPCTDLIYAWTALHAPCVAQPLGKVVQMAPYRYRQQFHGSAAQPS